MTPTGSARGRAPGWLVLLLALPACVGVASTYPCTQASECMNLGVAGTCEPTGFCSFGDADCASGSRYSPHAPAALAGQCVDGEGVPDGGGVDARAGGPDGARSTCGTTGALGPTFALTEWTNSISGDGASASIEVGEVRLELSSPDLFAALNSNDRLIFEESELAVEMRAETDFPSIVEWGGGLAIDTPEATIVFMLSWGNLTAKVDDSIGVERPYDADAHRHLRVRERAGEIFWEVSDDGEAWQLFDRVTSPATLGAGGISLFGFTGARGAGVRMRFLALNPSNTGPCSP